MKVTVIEPHGFCAGVTAALKKALTLSNACSTAARPRDPATSQPHELVHNEIVVADLKSRGFVFVESVESVPEGATVLFSAHGVGPDVRARAEARRLNVVDATCPFVARVHKAAKAFAARGLPVVVVGNPAHAEVKGIVGEVPGAVVVGSLAEARGLELPFGGHAGGGAPTGPTPHEPRATSHEPRPSLGVVSQTTMNADEVTEIVAELGRRFDVETMAEVCNATKERQDAVKAFGGDALLVLGSASSSNTRRLCEVARCRAFRAGTMEEVESLDLSGVAELGVTSGASTPESFFRAAVAYLGKQGVGGAPAV